MSRQDFAQAQVNALWTRLYEEFPESEVWVGTSRWKRHIKYRVGDYKGEPVSVHRFPDAIENIVDLVRAALR